MREASSKHSYLNIWTYRTFLLSQDNSGACRHHLCPRCRRHLPVRVNGAVAAADAVLDVFRPRRQRWPVLLHPAYRGSLAALVFGLVGALIAATTATGQLERALNRLYGVEQDRPSVKKYTFAFLLAALLILAAAPTSASASMSRPAAANSRAARFRRKRSCRCA